MNKPILHTPSRRRLIPFGRSGRRPLLGIALVLTLALVSGRALALFINGSFEDGTLTGWTISPYLNPGLSGPISGPFTGANIVKGAGGIDESIIVFAGAPETGVDPYLGAASTFRFPKYGNNCARVNGPAAGQNANALSQSSTVQASDFDPVDGVVHVRFAYAPVIQDPDHDPNQKPYFYVSVRKWEGPGTTLLYERLVFSGQTGVPWKTSTVDAGVKYTDWQVVDIVPSTPLDVGDIVILEVIAAGCSLGAHFGYLYVDGFGEQIPGLSIAKTANLPEVVGGHSLVYTFNYRNGGATAVDNVVVQETIPTCATYVSATNPSTGGTCSFSAGVVTCSLGTLGPGVAGTFTVTVTASADFANCASIENGNYTIAGTGISPTLGQLVSTPIVGICSPRSTLAINTGWNQFEGTVQPVGDVDNEWMVVSDPFPSTTERRPAFNIPTYRPGIAWADPQALSNWISSYPSAAQDANGTYAFEYRFCLASSDNASVAMSIRADDEAIVYLNNFPIGTVNAGSFMYNVSPVSVQYTGNALNNLFSAGINTIRVDVRNVHNVAMGLDVVGTITGEVPQYRYCCTDSAGGVLGKVWLDSNSDGVMSGSEAAKEGWTVKLRVGTAVVRSTTTDIFGNYYFLDLAPGTYLVGCVYGQGTLSTTDVSHTVTLGLGQIVPNQDFGFRPGTRGPDVQIHNSPNPFNPQTSILFSTAKPGRVNLIIYDVAGRLVRVLANEELAAGEHKLVWDGRDESGLAASSGVYFYRLTTDGNSQTGKMIMLK